MKEEQIQKNTNIVNALMDYELGRITAEKLQEKLFDISDQYATSKVKEAVEKYKKNEEKSLARLVNSSFKKLQKLRELEGDNKLKEKENA